MLADEVAELARKYLTEPGCGGYREIERQCLDAVGEARWDDVSKWHRVRLRYLRLQQQREMGARLAMPGGSAGGAG